ncbi:MAG: VWA domain-containing protein, partial [Chromatiales bacterium]|nr:VWA domain-containing protein [Chromatiales bacterium]
MTLRLLVVLAFFLSSISLSFAQETRNLLVILDASNSMWGQVDGVAKITTAREALSKMIGEVPDNVNIGLMAYGHNDAESCSDVDFLTAFVDKPNRDSITTAMNDIKPKGKTPIAWALKAGGTVMSQQHPNAQNSIVLISDGIETCNGNPCAVASELSTE